VLRAFLEDTASKMVTLATSSQDRPRIKREAHSIKSSAATFGFDNLSGLAKQLEFGAETIGLAKLQESVCELQRAFEITRQFAQASLLEGMAT
jgi:HPt (histidine-containing phosphotransfer) domain-containing protein